MNNCCNICHKPDCCGGCKPPCFSGRVTIDPDPYDSSYWWVNLNGIPSKVKVPDGNETDTVLSTNYSGAYLNYKAEKHTDKVTGAQLGSIINLSDLRDTDIDDALDGNCYELVFRKFSECGDGCKSAADKWMNFNINTPDIKRNGIQYVRGANENGCPVYLDVPPVESEYWFGMWRPNDTGEGIEFGYHQPEYVDTLPSDALGNTLVMSIDPTTKKPVYGPLPLDCILGNLMGNLAIDIWSTWSVVQATPAFTADFNNITGDFQINWNDWNTGQHVGTGQVTGKLNYSTHFDTSTGSMQYTFHSVYFNTISWWRDGSYTGSSYPYAMVLKGIQLGTGIESVIFSRGSWNSDWSTFIDATIPCDYTTTLTPGQTFGPLNFVYIYVDWILDDEGYLQINMKNKLSGWQDC